MMRKEGAKPPKSDQVLAIVDLQHTRTVKQLTLPCGLHDFGNNANVTCRLRREAGWQDVVRRGGMAEGCAASHKHANLSPQAGRGGENPAADHRRKSAAVK